MHLWETAKAGKTVMHLWEAAKAGKTIMHLWETAKAGRNKKKKRKNKEDIYGTAHN